MTEHDDDPARNFLDQTVPQADEWVGREPEEGPARPRHVQYPTAPEPPVDPKVRRKETVKRVVRTWVPGIGYTATVLALSADEGDAEADMGDQMDMGDMGGMGDSGS
jgi:hypothetical protein